jgi:hypothetical protein
VATTIEPNAPVPLNGNTAGVAAIGKNQALSRIPPDHFPTMDVTYRGNSPDNPTGSRLVVTELANDVISPSPTSSNTHRTYSAGATTGSRAELARSLLIHAIGDNARCTRCDGTRSVVYDIATSREIPTTRAQLEEYTIVGDDAEPQPRYSKPCNACDDGYAAISPAVYQHSKS